MASVMGALGDRWGVLIMRDLYLGLRRYDELRQSTGATHATLSDRLKALEQNGLVERRLYQERPDRYEYILTQRGRSVGVVMLAMIQVGDEWNLDGLEGPPIRFIDRTTGHPVKLAPIDTETGGWVNPSNIAVESGPGADAITKWRLEQAAKNRKASAST
jgi:DNA-binding HxlR family transcriptional regulator